MSTTPETTEAETEVAMAWDCDPFMVHVEEHWNDGLDEEDDEGDWQFICLDRFGDRLVYPRWFGRGSDVI